VTRLRDEQGFTLVELMVVMLVGGIVLAMLMVTFVNTLQGSARSYDRVEAAQRARLAMDRMTSLLDSQVCLSAAKPPVVSADANQVTFLADIDSRTFSPRQYRLSYDPATRKIREERWNGTGTVPDVVYAGAPDVTRTLADNVLPRTAGAPVFSFWTFTATSPPTVTAPILAPVAPADLGRVLRTSIAFVATPDRVRVADPRSASIESDSYVATLDATDPAGGPRCA